MNTRSITTKSTERLSHTLPVTPQMAEVTTPQRLVETILNQIAQLSPLAQANII
ncbi:MAG: hypothetical protein VX677_01445 [Candidatus Poribacteria bacterium]|nr:hypothetical protein [Candidatus Poribacteria bacterium]